MLGAAVAANPTIRVSELTKTFVVPEREAGLLAATRSLVRRRHRCGGSRS
jgi:hypothetical protein